MLDFAVNNSNDLGHVPGLKMRFIESFKNDLPGAADFTKDRRIRPVNPRHKFATTVLGFGARVAIKPAFALVCLIRICNNFK